jgi:hypothetical protein
MTAHSMQSKQMCVGDTASLQAAAPVTLPAVVAAPSEVSLLSAQLMSSYCQVHAGRAVNRQHAEVVLGGAMCATSHATSHVE